MPMPATATPAGSSQIAPRRSEQRPKNGWMTDEETADASMIAAASVYERSKRSTKNGSSAGRAPFAKSVARWPLASAAIARLSISARTSASLAAGPLHEAARSWRWPVTDTREVLQDDRKWVVGRGAPGGDARSTRRGGRSRAAAGNAR